MAVLFLVLAALVLSWPILAGGYLTYADNAAHIAEIYSLAFENGGGWSDIAFCGFPIGMLHSPLWYGAVAGLVRAGVPAGFLYALALFIGFVAPPLALYFVARRSLRPLTAGLRRVSSSRPAALSRRSRDAARGDVDVLHRSRAFYRARVAARPRNAFRARPRLGGNARRAYRHHASLSRSARRGSRRHSSGPFGAPASPSGGARAAGRLRGRGDPGGLRVLAPHGPREGEHGLRAAKPLAAHGARETLSPDGCGGARQGASAGVLGASCSRGASDVGASRPRCMGRGPLETSQERSGAVRRVGGAHHVRSHRIRRTGNERPRVRTGKLAAALFRPNRSGARRDSRPCRGGRAFCGSCPARCRARGGRYRCRALSWVGSAASRGDPRIEERAR